MSSRWFTRLLLATVAGLTISATTAIADPSARVARISFVSGSVSFRPASLGDWSAASLNYPLTIGDHLWADRGARGELELGSTIVRLAPLTEFSVLNLDDRTAQLRVTQGAVLVRVRALDAGDAVEIDTPNGAVSVLRAGLYRIDVDNAGNASTVTVRDGEADVATGGADLLLQRDQSAVLGDPDATRADVRQAARTDDFEDWCLTRERRVEAAQVRYVSPEMIGFEDLDANGTWQVVEEYGAVWLPRVRAEWVPYRFGHWAWVDPWGWTWIDDAPWGFAPFHYGRWTYLPSSGWAWVPGTRVARPVYAPALVAFVGGGSWSVSGRLGNGPVGWFPLGPREPYVPVYHVTPEYVRRVNAAHVTNINVTNINVTNIAYVNRTVPGAVTAVPRETFVQARAVAATAVAIPREQAQAAPVVAAAAVAPQRASVAGPPHSTPAPPAVAVRRQVVVRQAPPPPPPAFAAKQAALQQRPGVPLDASAETALRARAPHAAAHPLVRAVAPVHSAPAAAAPPAPRQNPPPSAAPAAGAPPAPPHATAPPAGDDLAARHAQERAEMNARHAQERAALQARHQQEQQAAAPARRAQLQQRHAQEMKALQTRQKQERAATQKRQQEERKKKGA